MINPGLFGSDVERRASELGSGPRTNRVIREKTPRKNGSGHRIRIVVGRHLISWGESLASDLRSPRIRGASGDVGC